MSVSRSDNTKKSRAYHFAEKQPVTEADADRLSESVRKDFPIAVWEKLGVKVGELHHEKKGIVDRFVLGFPLPGGGWKVYRPSVHDKEKRWLFADGGKGDLLGEIVGDSVLITEGEWDMMAALARGMESVVTGTNGAGTFKKEWISRFRDKRVAIIYDVKDGKEIDGVPFGQYHARKVAEKLAGVATSVKNIVLPLEKAGGDLTDYFGSGKTKEDLERLIEETPVFTADGQQSFDWSNPQPEVSIEEVRETVIRNFDENVWAMTEVALTAAVTLLFKDVVNPKGIIFEGVPSSQKTTVLGFFEDLEGITYKSDSFTPKSFLSHAATVSRKKLKEIDLLPRIRNKVLIIPEMAPVLGKRQEDLLESLSILTRVFDGRGLSTDSGIQGRRSLTGDYYFAMLAATTPIEWRVWKLMGKLGSRLLVYSVPEEKETVESLLHDVKNGEPYVKRCERCKDIVHRFLRYRWHREGGPRTVAWDSSRDDDKLVAMIAQVSLFATTARSIVSVWKDRDDEDYDFRRAILEGKRRMMTLLYDLAKAHALTFGRDQVGEEDVAFVMKLGLMSMPEDRRLACELLLTKTESERGEVTVSEIERRLRISTNTAKKLMETLQVLGIGRLEKEPSYKLTLAEEYAWFLGEEFEKLYHRQKSDGVLDEELRDELEDQMARHGFEPAQEQLPF